MRCYRSERREDSQGKAAGSSRFRRTGIRKKAVILLIAVLLSCGCAGKGKEEADPVFCEDAADFSIRLLKSSLADKSGDNVCVSSASVLTALSMAANGAQGNTLSQMLSVIAPHQDLDSLNRNMKAWTDGLTDTWRVRLDLSNSVWIRDDRDLTIEEAFLEKNDTCYHAQIHESSFGEETVDAINAWVEKKTRGEVSHMLDSLSEDAVLYLINTAVFDARWKEVYRSFDVWEGSFTNANGTKENVHYMDSVENIYFRDENAAGFIKPYKKGYDFVAVLPYEEMSPEEYLETLNGEHFLTLLSEARTGVKVEACMPSYEAEYETDLQEALISMGMEDAFEWEEADFGKMGHKSRGNICISHVLHRTSIAVGRLGTKATAVTAVEKMCETSVEEEEVYKVSLTRPFLYAIVEDQTNVPIFMGILNQVKEE